MGKKDRGGDIVKFPVHPPGAGQGSRKLSEILKEMAMRLLRQPDAIPSMAAVEATLLLAVAAWNDACGDPGVRRRHREMLAKYEWSTGTPWPELLDTDTECLITGLVEYKHARHARDRRRILGFGISPEGTIQVQWSDPDRAASSGVAAAQGVWAPTPSEAPCQPIADKLLALLRRQRDRKVVDLRVRLAARVAAEGLLKTIVTEKDLAEMHSVHAIYVWIQNHVSVLSEQLTGLAEMAPLVEILGPAETRYMPSGPPMSPLTPSYFTCWAFFDACVGPGQETIGTAIMALGPALGMDADVHRVIGLMQRSRMGIYVHQGHEGDQVILRELVTGLVHRALVASGYRGQKGELWYARVLPPPLLGTAAYVVMTTPYVLLGPGMSEWLAYFRRSLVKAPAQARAEAYEHHMKFGPTRTYWPEFVFEGYSSHETEVIRLWGLPDVAASRPHSAVNSRRSDR